MNMPPAPNYTDLMRYTEDVEARLEEYRSTVLALRQELEVAKKERDAERRRAINAESRLIALQRERPIMYEHPRWPS